MNTKAMLEQLLQSGQQLAERGRDAAEEKLGIPNEGPERDALLSTLGKGAMAGGVLALLVGTKTGRSLGGAALKLGSLAAVGGLAYNAYRNWQNKQGGDNADPGKPIEALAGSAADQRSLNLIKAMVAAAKADGHIDEAERDKLKQQLERFQLSADSTRALAAVLDQPLDAKSVAAAADSPEAAAEMYLASLIVIDVDNAQERAYLQQLADALQLSPQLIAEIESEVAT